MKCSKFYLITVSSLLAFLQVNIASPIEEPLNEVQPPSDPQALEDATFDDTPTIVDFTTAFDALPKDVFGEIKFFLTDILRKMPGDNAVGRHFAAGYELMLVYEKLKSLHENLNEVSRQELMLEGAQIAQELKEEMDQGKLLVQPYDDPTQPNFETSLDQNGVQNVDERVLNEMLRYADTPDEFLANTNSDSHRNLDQLFFQFNNNTEAGVDDEDIFETNNHPVKL